MSTSSKRTVQRLFIISKSRYNVIIPKYQAAAAAVRHYASKPNKKLEASMGGIFEPFLNDKM
jgi:hypothetical protein